MDFIDKNREEKRSKPNIYNRSELLDKRDPTIGKIIKDIVADKGYSEAQVWGAISHFLSWQRGSIQKAEYSEYLWPRCITIKWFERKTQNKHREGWEKHKDRLRLKDENRVSIPDEIPKDRVEIIGKISAFSPSLLASLSPKRKEPYQTFFWWIGGSTNEGDWNKLTMGTASMEVLEKLLELLIKLDNEQSNNDKDKENS